MSQATSSLLARLHSYNQKQPELEITGLQSPLRPYQKRALYWMVDRENNKKVVGIDKGKDLLTGEIWDENKQELGDVVKGGILADEMGLGNIGCRIIKRILISHTTAGKTLEVIALILAHPRSLTNERKRQHEQIDQQIHDGQCIAQDCTKPARSAGPDISGSSAAYCSLKCFQNNARLKNHQENEIIEGGTLVIAPYTILNQWEAELKKHAPQLSVFIFSGHNELQYRNKNADYLAAHDVVLTDYNTLQKEVHRAQQDKPRLLRGGYGTGWQKSFLLRVNWWRLCLDEAQEVQGIKETARMAEKIVRTHTWAITGTPIPKTLRKGVDEIDLAFYHLFRALKASPRIMEHFDVNTAVPGLFWRNTKESVQKEMQLPTQHKETHFSHFTAVEVRVTPHVTKLGFNKPLEGIIHQPLERDG
jgi:SNF2 family DNA or RNA helicase